MRNVKKFLALVLAMLMVVSAAATVSAFEDVAEDNLFAEAIADLTVLEIVNGYDGETFGPEDAVTRQQFALMMARAITGIVGDDAVWAQGGLVGFEDVTEYQYAIATVVKAGIVDGFLDNTFRPDEGVTFIQALKMAVAALGYDDGNLDWWQGYYNVALDLGLTKNLNQITDADKALNRGEVAQLVWNMLYAPAANGSSLAYDIFGIGVEEPVEEPATVTTLVVTATTKQYATENIDVAEGGFVGVQEIVNGVPAGEVYYVAIDALGFEDDAAAEAAYLSAYNFYNWDAEAATFDAAEVTGLVEVITNADVTATSKDAAKIKIDGVNYYPVEETTGTAIKNEIVVFNADKHIYVHTEKTLAVEKDGQVYGYADFDGDGVVTFGPVLSAGYVGGEIIYFRDLVDNKILDYEEAAKKYGRDVKSDYETSLEFLTVEDLIEVPAYQMTVYDDDMDGKWDRAYTTTVYVSAHDDTVASSGAYEYGPMASDPDANTNGKKTNFAVTWVDVEGNEVDLAQGDVYKYTYNEQLNQVTVLETYEIQYGTIDRVYTVNDKASANYEVAVRIDGVDYVLGNQYRENLGLDGFVLTEYTGAAVNALANLKGLKNDGGKFHDGIASINYTYDVNFAPAAFKAKNYVGFVEIDGVIILMETIADENNYKLALFEDFVNYDLDAIYLDLWVDGVVEEDVAVTRIQKENGKYADIAELSTRELMKAYQYYLEADKGDVYKYVINDDGVTLSRAMGTYEYDKLSTTPVSYELEHDAAEVVEKDTLKADGTVNKHQIGANAFGLAWFDNNNSDIVFDNGIGEITPKDNTYALRTSSSTLFYFVNVVDETISTFKGTPKDNWYIADSAIVFANKLGFVDGTGASDADPINTLAGAASTVVVYFTDLDEIGGFSVNGLKSKLVYMTTALEDDYYYVGNDYNYFDPYENYNGYDLGLDRQYWDETFYLYTTKAGIDMYTGKAVSKIFVSEDATLVPGKYYWMTENNVIIGKGMTAAEAELETGVADFSKDIVSDYDRELKVANITGLTDNNYYDAVYMVKADAANDQIKSGVTNIDALYTTGKKNVTYLVTVDGDTKIFVGIVGGDYLDTSLVNGAPTVYVDDNYPLAGVVKSMTVGTNVAATVDIYNATANVARDAKFTADTRYGDGTTGKTISLNASIDELWVKVTKLATSIEEVDTVISANAAGTKGDYWKLSAGSKLENGTLTVKGIDNPYSNTDAFEAGSYVAEIGEWDTTNNNYTVVVTLYFTVPAAN